MTCYQCPKCEVELCMGSINPSDDMDCPECGGQMKPLNKEDF